MLRTTGVPHGGRRTKIVATVGPATQSPERIRDLLESGVDVLRFNFSHGRPEEHRTAIEHARRIGRDLGKPVAVLQDLQGPRLRVGAFEGGLATLVPGQEFVLHAGPVMGTAQGVSVSYAKLPQEVRVGQRVLVDDGRVLLRAQRIMGQEIVCVVEIGGVVKDRKGINVPGALLTAPPLTKKDIADLEFGVMVGVDYVALSFVRSPEDARAIRHELLRLKARTPVIAKIEKPEAVDAIDDILRAFDGVMIARGDLGVEMGAERVPLLQKEIIKKANSLYKPVITATQMLESMVSSPTPTRAEASDVANAILDGTDAVMLSAETSIGAYPLEAVSIMDRLAREVDVVEGEERQPLASYPAQAVVRASHHLAREIGARAIIVFTTSGRTAQLLSKHRPQVPVFAFTRRPEVYNALALWWGITPMMTPFAVRTTEMVEYVQGMMIEMGVARRGERVIIIGSAPLTSRGRTNFIKVQSITHRAR